jgi:hypothetical protein
MTILIREILTCPKCNKMYKNLACASYNTFGRNDEKPYIWTDGVSTGPNILNEFGVTSGDISQCIECGSIIWNDTMRSIQNDHFGGNLDDKLYDSLSVIPPLPTHKFLEALPLVRNHSDELFLRIKTWQNSNPHFTKEDLETVVIKWNNICKKLNITLNTLCYKLDKDKHLKAGLFQDKWKILFDKSSSGGSFRIYFKEKRVIDYYLSKNKYNKSKNQLNNMKHLIEFLNETDKTELLFKAEILRQLGRFEECINLSTRFISSKRSNKDIYPAIFIKELAKKENVAVQEIDYKEFFKED